MGTRPNGSWLQTSPSLTHTHARTHQHYHIMNQQGNTTRTEPHNNSSNQIVPVPKELSDLVLVLSPRSSVMSRDLKSHPHIFTRRQAHISTHDHSHKRFTTKIVLLPCAGRRVSSVQGWVTTMAHRHNRPLTQEQQSCVRQILVVNSLRKRITTKPHRDASILTTLP